MPYSLKLTLFALFFSYGCLSAMNNENKKNVNDSSSNNKKNNISSSLSSEEIDISDTEIPDIDSESSGSSTSSSSLNSTQDSSSLCGFSNSFDGGDEKPLFDDREKDQTIFSVKKLKELRRVSFFDKNKEYKLIENSESFLEEVAYKLVSGAPLSIKEKYDHINNKTTLDEWSKVTRPHIILSGKQKQDVDKTSATKLKKATEVEGKPEDEQVVTLVSAKLNTKEKGFNLKRSLRSIKNNSEIKKKNNIIKLESKGVCLAYNKYNNTVYVGCEDGSIHAINAATKKFTHSFKSDDLSVGALQIIKNGTSFISIHCLEDQEGNVFKQGGTYVWSVDDLRPRLSLAKEEFSETYVTFDGNKIIRSHIGGKGLASSIFKMTMSVTDGEYKIPHGYLRGIVPGDDIRRIAFMWLLKKIQDNEYGSYSVNSLQESTIIDTFEPPVTKALKKQLEIYAQKYDN